MHDKLYVFDRFLCVFPETEENGCCLFESLVYVIDKIALSQLQDVANMFNKNKGAMFFTPKEQDDFNRYGLFYSNTEQSKIQI